MDAYILTFVGIAVAVALYYLGYRQTIGARKEKIRAANSEIEKTLLKRVVLESYQPSVQELSRLIETKARDYSLRSTDLHSEVQVLNTLFTRIIETDFISPDKRGEILERITPVFTQAEEKPVEETTMAELASVERRQKVRMSLSLFMAVIASLLGAFTAFSYRLLGSQEIMLSAVLVTVGASFVVIIFIWYIYRFRESQEEVASSSSNLRSALSFEGEVVRVLEKTGAKSFLAKAGSNYDFRTELRGKKILIEVKVWSRRMPLGMLRSLIARLDDALAAEQADEAIIVTKAPVGFPPQALEGTKIRLMTLNELRNYIVHEG